MSVVQIDGRTARRDRNRTAVLDAVIELFTAGNFDPTAEEVAQRSGVSLRSVYRYVADKDDLSRAAIARHIERVGHLFAVPDLGTGSFSERVARLVDARLRLYDAVAATYRAARWRAPMNPVLAAQLELRRRDLREQLERQFAPELRSLPTRARRHVATAADALTQIDTIDHFRVQCRLSPRATRDVLVDAQARLFDRRGDA
jgi:AcrR family transcriptional regulator